MQTDSNDLLSGDNLLNQIVNISKAAAYDILAEQVKELQSENQRLTTLNEVLAATLESSNTVISECYGYFSASNFTDRYGTADRLKQAHDEAKAALQQVTKQ